VETTPAPEKKNSPEALTKNIERLAIEKKLVTPTRRSKLQSFLNSTFAKVVLTLLLFSSLFAVAFVISYLSTQKKVSEPLSGPDIVPTAEIKLPTDISTGGIETPSPKLSLTPGKPISGGNCTVVGCNDELCVDESQKDNIASICVYKDEYACYKNAKCEKQADGKCSWTQSTELTNCISQNNE
jgi:hypothetical protein